MSLKKSTLEKGINFVALYRNSLVYRDENDDDFFSEELPSCM